MRLDPLIRDQAGVVSRAQAVAHGVPLRTVQSRVRRGAWSELLPGVYLVGGHRPTDEARVRAAWLWGGERSVVDGPAAAFWLGMRDGAPDRIGVTVPPPTRRRLPEGLRVRRRAVDPWDRVVVRGVAVTAPALTGLETAAVVPDGAAFLDRALQRRVRFADLYAAYLRQMGTHGSARVRPLLVAAADRADSALERRLVGLLRDAGVDGFVVGLPFEGWWIDLAFPGAGIAVEIDGWAFHTDPARFRNDRRKGNALVSAGWTLLRFTWSDITEHPARTVAQIRAALDRAA